MSAFYRARDGGIDLFVRLTPKSGTDRVDAIQESADGRSHLAVRVRAAPEKGAANTALERVIAECLKIPRSTVTVVAGHTARLKTVRIEADPAAISTKLDTFAAAED
ncbi:DUF167 domain-containing protein [Pseudaminobacter sp. 19-2017]|uniref:UPF0235 protein KEU06_04660 n=1 Tax=Pseudaminobacter soli (ex Zhang et al. 2022) TaxID=2831468 RepID=A0A942DZF7_9HYPH|nr:DUF167 family protein [Pseudaminobacter soli]MBS3647920.1 DUF167 domain-containing protein [Pseudaminobacter soli]